MAGDLDSLVDMGFDRVYLHNVGRNQREFLETFGDKLYMLYGSTEVSWASIAQPSELRSEPGTAGRAPAGTELRVLDDHDDVQNVWSNFDIPDELMA